MKTKATIVQNLEDANEPMMSYISYRMLKYYKILMKIFTAVLVIMTIPMLIIPIIGWIIFGMFVYIYRYYRAMTKELEREFEFHHGLVYQPKDKFAAATFHDNGNLEVHVRQIFARVNKNIYKKEESEWLKDYHEFLDDLYKQTTDHSYDSVFLWHMAGKKGSEVLSEEERMYNYLNLVRMLRQEEMQQQEMMRQQELMRQQQEMMRQQNETDRQMQEQVNQQMQEQQRMLDQQMQQQMMNQQMFHM